MATRNEAGTTDRSGVSCTRLGMRKVAVTMGTSGQNASSMPGAKANKLIIPPHWGAILALIAIGVLYALLPQKVNGGPAWLLLTIEGVIILPLLIAILTGHRISLTTRRIGSLVLLGVVTIAMSVAVVHLIFTLKKDLNGGELLYTGLLLYACNSLVFSLWYWAVDGGGSDQRLLSEHRAFDFLFPQQVGGFDAVWIPHYFDYLYVAFTGATAFSPTDTMPLSHRAKFLMMAEAFLALLLISFVVSRAINII